MPELNRTTLLDALNEWAEYPNTFKHLTADRQAAFLKGQGFSSLQDLLGHVIGWWEEGLRVVRGVRSDPGFVYHEPDTDGFNAQLVEKFHAWDEGDVLDYFEKTRKDLAVSVKDLPDEMLNMPLIQEWLIADVIEHLDEHRLSA